MNLTLSTSPGLAVLLGWTGSPTHAEWYDNRTTKRNPKGPDFKKKVGGSTGGSVALGGWAGWLAGSKYEGGQSAVCMCECVCAHLYTKHEHLLPAAVFPCPAACSCVVRVLPVLAGPLCSSRVR
jgi:hypothetical protein